ncbi:ABC transporter ATP-binding protein [Geotalea uraniireducens]|uniref:Iron-regulated ABC transporter ATPase subunit SufC n=1 Tax=Geotalea uraniireducens (strain Rf4) TaxID=351605 RepID=A5G4B3_GEOUR|nr:ABC transporter ATP-binding protein [Geotalea uraniireducens]ABQ26631.1 Iron-regulated ABC transporter ATPase subunit SufC [Geotalea uraniireducens Rf4]
MIEVTGLTVRIGEKRILRDVNLRIEAGTVAVLFGPNGCGKTSLLKTIMGVEHYRVESGRILFRGEDITGLAIDERARLGIGMAFQRPPAVRGVKLREILRICMEKRRHRDEDELFGLARQLNLADFLDRDINLGFSGGEIKRSELLQLMGQEPSFIMLDEPDSGVDLVNINLVGRAINDLLEKEKAAAQRGRAGLIVTHSGYVLDYVNADRAYVMLDGTVYCSGNPRDLLEDIRTKGYEGCVQCRG